MKPDRTLGKIVALLVSTMLFSGCAMLSGNDDPLPGESSTSHPADGLDTPNRF